MDYFVLVCRPVVNKLRRRSWYVHCYAVFKVASLDRIVLPLRDLLMI